jgi:tRNA 2-thiouridine synthesizing protein A
MEWNDTLDAVDMLCPLPVLKARKRLAGMQPGLVLRVIATDPASVIDMPHFCSHSGDVLLSATQNGAAHVFLIRKGSARDLL